MFRVKEREHDKPRLSNPLSKTEGPECDLWGNGSIERMSNLAPVMIVSTKDHIRLDPAKDLAGKLCADHVLKLYSIKVENRLFRFPNVATVGRVGSEEGDMGKQDPWQSRRF